MTEQPSTSWANWAWQAYRDGRLIEVHTPPAVTVVVTEDLAKRITDRSIERLRALYKYAGRAAWDKVLAEEIAAALDLTPVPDAQAVKRVVDLLDNLTERKWVIDGLTLSELKEITDAIGAMREVQSHKSE